MPRAVRWNDYGGADVLDVVEVDRPTAGDGEVVVEVVSTSINPGEISIREGLLRERFPATFPSGEGSDLAGRIVEVGPRAGSWSVGDDVIGWTDARAAQADFVIVPVEHLVAKPAGVGWDVGGSLFVAGTTAYAAVRAVKLQAGETVAVSAAAGGVGSIVVQLARQAGATVIGIAGPDNVEWLRSLGVTPVEHGDGLAERLRSAAPDGVDAFIDNFGSGYVALAVEQLGVSPDRVNTIADFGVIQKFGVHADGTGTAANADVLGELTTLVDTGDLTVPIARTYPLEEVREAYTELARRHTRGKIVLRLR